MTVTPAIREGWLAIFPGMVLLAIFVRQLWTGKAVTRRWMAAGLRIYHRETQPLGFWSLAVLTGGSAIFFLGLGISRFG